MTVVETRVMDGLSSSSSTVCFHTVISGRFTVYCLLHRLLAQDIRMCGRDNKVSFNFQKSSATGDRTRDLLLRRTMLSRVSYHPHFFYWNLSNQSITYKFTQWLLKIDSLTLSSNDSEFNGQNVCNQMTWGSPKHRWWEQNASPVQDWAPENWNYIKTHSRYQIQSNNII